MSYDRLRAFMSAPRVFSRAPSTLSELWEGIEGVRGSFEGWGSPSDEVEEHERSSRRASKKLPPGRVVGH